MLRPEDEPPRQHRRRANPSADGIVYPCGAVPWVDDGWLVSYGVNDERCCLRVVHLPHAPGLEPLPLPSTCENGSPVV